MQHKQKEPRNALKCGKIDVLYGTLKNL